MNLKVSAKATRMSPKTDLGGWALKIFILGILTLELQLFMGDGRFNFGNVIMVAVSAITAVLVFKFGAKDNSFKLAAQDYFYFIYLVWCFVSLVWSPSKVNTGVQVVFLIALWIGTTANSYSPPRDIAKFIVTTAFILALLSFAMIPIFPGRAWQPHDSMGFRELRGVFQHQLKLGAYMSVALGFITIAYVNGEQSYVIHRHKIMRALIAVVITACTIMALSRGYTAGAILGLPISFLLSKRGWLRWTAIIFLLVSAVLIVVFSTQLFTLLGELTGDPTLTGRTLIWTGVLEQWLWGPQILGYGYASFNLPTFDYMWPYYRPPHAHNSFLHVLFETGGVGLFLLALFIIAQFTGAIKNGPKVGRMSYALFMVSMLFFASLTDVDYGGKPAILFALTLLMVGSEARLKTRFSRPGKKFSFSENTPARSETTQ